MENEQVIERIERAETTADLHRIWGSDPDVFCPPPLRAYIRRMDEIPTNERSLT